MVVQAMARDAEVEVVIVRVHIANRECSHRPRHWWAKSELPSCSARASLDAEVYPVSHYASAGR